MRQLLWIPICIVALLVPVVVLAGGGQGGFDGVVDSIESRYHVHATRIPFLGCHCDRSPALLLSAGHDAPTMLKGTRSAIIKRLQPVSIHGQMSVDVFFVDPEDPEEEIRHARVGSENTPRDLDVGDRVTLHYLMGSVTQITKV